jgi:PAS domain S-box-containing protein
MSTSSNENNIIRALESSNNIIMFSLDRNYSYTSFTRSHQITMKKLWDVDIHVGDNMLEFLPQPDKSKSKANFDRALAGERFSIVEEFGDKNLMRSFWEDRYDPIIDDNGDIIGVVVFVLDVSSMVQTSRTLQDTQTTLRLALSATRTGVWEWHMQGNRVFWSDEIYEIFNFPKTSEFVTFEEYKNFIHPDDRKGVAEILQAAIELKKEYHVEHRVKRIDQAVRWIKAVGVVFYNIQGQPEKMLGTVQDITERKLTEQEKRGWQIRYDLIVKSSGQMVYDYNTNTGKILWTGSTQEVLGFSHEEMGDITHWSELIHPEDKERILEELDHAQNNLSKFEVVYRFRHRDGLYKIVSDRGFFIRDNDPTENVRMLGIMEDISREKETERNLIVKNEELTKTNQELDRFVYSASHDLRAPIASLLGLIKVVRLEKSLENIEVLLNMQEKTLLKLDTFIRDIVDHSRNARMAMAQQVIDFNKVINESFEHFNFLDNLKNINKSIDVRETCEFTSDPGRIQIILNNLISNSIKYIDLKKDEPFISIKVDVNAREARIIVEDNGEGILPEMQGRIFDMFVRATEHSSGSGLGLYIVKEVVDKLNGKIKVHSEFGKGSVFTVTLPNQLTEG